MHLTASLTIVHLLGDACAESAIAHSSHGLTTNLPTRLNSMEAWWTYASQTLGDFNVFVLTAIAAGLVLLAIAWIGARQFEGIEANRGASRQKQDGGAAPARPAEEFPSNDPQQNDCTAQQTTQRSSSVNSTQTSTTSAATTSSTLPTVKSRADASSQRSATDGDSRSLERDFCEQNVSNRSSAALTDLAESARLASIQRHPIRSSVHGNSADVSSQTGSASESLESGTLQQIVFQRVFSVAGWLSQKLSDVTLYLKAREGICRNYLHAESDIPSQADHPMRDEQPETHKVQEPRVDIKIPFCRALATPTEVHGVKAVAAEFRFVPLVSYCDTTMSRLLAVLYQKRVVQIPELHGSHDLARDLQSPDVGSRKRQPSDHGDQMFQESDLNLKAREFKEVGAGLLSSSPCIQSSGHRLTDGYRDPENAKGVRFVDQVPRHVNTPGGYDSYLYAENGTFADDGSGLSDGCNCSSSLGLASYRDKDSKREVNAPACRDDNNQLGGRNEDTTFKVPRGDNVLQNRPASLSCLTDLGCSSCARYTADQPDVQGPQEPQVNFLLAFYKRLAFTLVTFRFGDLQTGVQLGQLLLCCVYVHLAAVCSSCPLLKQVCIFWRLLASVIALDFPGFCQHAHSFFCNIRVLLAGWVRALCYILTGSLILLLMTWAREALAFFLAAIADVIARLRGHVMRQWRRLFSDVKRRMRRYLWRAVVRPLVGAALWACELWERFVPGNESEQ